MAAAAAPEKELSADCPTHEEGPWSKKEVDAMIKEIEAPRDLSWADELEADEEGFKPVTWTQLRQGFSYEAGAKNFKLVGDISFKNHEHWQRQKQIRIRDGDGEEGAIFFYDPEAKPYFDWDDIQLGNRISIKAPRLHRFLDGQEGMRLESNKSVARVKKERFTDVKRFDYGMTNKKNGNQKFEKKKYDDAIECYEQAIKHLQGTFHETPAEEQAAKEEAAKCHLNIAACHVAEKKWKFVSIPCEKALKINAGPATNAKAYYRMGTAALERGEHTVAAEHLNHAARLVPGDPLVVAAIERLMTARQEQRAAQTQLYKELPESALPNGFGYRRQLLSEAPTELVHVPNFRDVGGVPALLGTARLKKRILYRSASLATASAGDISSLTTHLGIKTLIDLRTWSEVQTAAWEQRETLKEQRRVAELLKSDPPPPQADFHNTFLPVMVTCPAGKAPTLKLVGAAKKRPQAEVLKGRVAFHLDVSTRAVFALASWWALAKAIFIGCFAFFSLTCMRHAAKILCDATCIRVGEKEFYKTVLKKHAPEIAQVVRIVADPVNHPVMLTCSMGKDRTGLVMALILAAADVSDADIVADYVRSSGSYGKAADVEEKRKAAKIPLVNQLGIGSNWCEAKADTILEMLASIRKDHGSVAAYFKTIGVSSATVEGLRSSLAA